MRQAVPAPTLTLPIDFEMTIGRVLTVVGCCVAIAGVLTFLVTWIRLSQWRRVDGVVVGEKTSLGTDKGRTKTYYAPVVRFTCLETGKPHTFEESVQSNIRPTLGARVQVLYNPLNPEKATVAGWRPYLVATIVFFGGVGVAAFGRFGLS